MDRYKDLNTLISLPFPCHHRSPFTSLVPPSAHASRCLRREWNERRKETVRDKKPSQVSGVSEGSVYPPITSSTYLTPPYILSSSLLSLRSSLLTLLTPSVVRHSRREPKGVGRGCRTKSRRHGGRKTRPDDGRCEGGMNDRRSACHLLASVPLSFGSSFHSSCRSFLPTSVLSAFGSVPEVNRKVNEEDELILEMTLKDFQFPAFFILYLF